MKVLVIGAHGRTGKMIVEMLSHGVHDPVAMIRNPGQRDTFTSMGVPTVLGDLEYPIDHAVRGCDAVIFAAGSGSKTGKDKTVLIDHVGAIRAAVTARVHDARRFVMLSALNADENSTSGIAHYHRAKGFADRFIREMDRVLESGLDYTIVCPGGLTNDPGTGHVTVSENLRGEGKTSREHVAAAIVGCLDRPNTVGKSFALIEGDTPLNDALASI